MGGDTSFPLYSFFAALQIATPPLAGRVAEPSLPVGRMVLRLMKSCMFHLLEY